MMIERILYEVYGVGITGSPREAIIWAAEKIEDTDQAKAELRRANRIRNKFGIGSAYPEFGSRLF